MIKLFPILQTPWINQVNFIGGYFRRFYVIVVLSDCIFLLSIYSCISVFLSGE